MVALEPSVPVDEAQRARDQSRDEGRADEWPLNRRDPAHLHRARIPGFGCLLQLARAQNSCCNTLSPMHVLGRYEQVEEPGAEIGMTRVKPPYAHGLSPKALA